MSESDAALVVRARKGDRTAFETLVRRTTRLLYARFYIDTGCPHRTEDLIQETFLLAYRSLHQLTDPAGFRAWLLALSRNVFIDDVRKSLRLKRLAPSLADVPLNGIAGSDLPPDEAAEREEERERVLAALRTLPEEYRLPIALRYLVGDDSNAIAEHLGVSPSAARSMIYRGLKVLRGRLPHDLRNGTADHPE